MKIIGFSQCKIRLGFKNIDMRSPNKDLICLNACSLGEDAATASLTIAAQDTDGDHPKFQ